MIYSISDLHFDYSKEKPMGIFGDNWKNHEEIIMENWKEKIGDDDLVLIAGDISWALKAEDAFYDLERIDKLPGKKILSKGNHDYWWSSLKKINDFNFETIDYIQNNSFVFENVGIAGTRGWSSIYSGEDKEKDDKIFTRELNRLRLSLESLPKGLDKIIVMLHYPPFDIGLKPNEFVDIMNEFEVDICIYGHLHGDGHKYAIEGNIQGVEFHCTASDFINFIPKKIL